MEKIIEGVRLGYDDAGSGDVIVLLHGFPYDRSLWDTSFNALQTHARVIRIDLRGSGESGCGVGPALMETLAGDVYGLLDALAIERVIVAGHSMGGYVALAFFRMYAERVAGLALVASQVGADPPARAIERDEAAATVAARGMSSIAVTTVANAVTPEFAARNPATIERLQALVARQDPAGAAAQIIGMKERVDSADLLEDIAVPALIIGGREDRLIAAQTLERTAAAISDCRYVSLAGTAHLPMLEAPQATIAALEELIARCAVTNSGGSRSAPATRA